MHAVKLLLEWGTDANKTTDSGTSPLFVAGVNGHAEVVTALEKNGANIDHFVGKLKKVEPSFNSAGLRLCFRLANVATRMW